MEEKILEIIRKMQFVLNENQLRELKATMNQVFVGCEIVENTTLRVNDNTWTKELSDFIISKRLSGLAVKTVNRYDYELHRLLSYINKNVKHILSTDISEYLTMYKAIRKACNQTLKNVRAIFNTFFIWLRDRGKISINPMALVETIKVEQKIKKPFTSEEREIMLRKCKNIRDMALIEFLYSTAIRVSELVALNITDIRFGNKDLIVYGKGGKERIVYINEKSNLYLKEYLKSRIDKNEALFVGKKYPHNRLSKSGIEYIVKEIGLKANVSNAHPHRFRRTSLTNALNRGMPLQEVMKFAGHSKPETTMMYCTVNEEGIKYHHYQYLSS
ncbi:tyrosine-type recombinase/integrase [Mediterraneibacter sp. NSJ-55]|uniref:Tyrosine-type recombinase/integrase n=1 Tax=Mediterraneibacter hominis TaxID=2763054 RepID=A0A923RP85_9FIRM|nr:tyrosine-type recombinase/integrase [Mediterraneibacter hominis]MBC5688244.1 tyrosine-type recombinase/integrase [Mediterraneibacter hominis]